MNGHEEGSQFSGEGEELWRHKDPKSTAMWRFLENVNEKYDMNLQTYADLHRWSVENVASFWEQVWHFTGIVASKGFDNVSVSLLQGRRRT